MIQADAVIFGAPSGSHALAPVIEPVTQSFIDLITKLALDELRFCRPALAPGGAYAWLSCEERGSGARTHVEAFLVSLPELELRPLGERLYLGAWSPDGRHVLYSERPEGEPGPGAGRTWLLPVDGQPLAVAERYANHANWHGSQAVAALQFADPRTVLFVDAATGQGRELALEAAIIDVAWEPARRGVALVAEGGSLLWLRDAFDSAQTPIELAPRLPGLHSARWSPDGRLLAFVSGARLFALAARP
jgi:hypothetical protein